MERYPLRLCPAFKDNLWGGQRLKTDYGKKTEMTPLAESWELSCHKDGSSVIANGPYAGMTLPEYLARFPDAAGSRCERFPAFPVLFKLIDAKDKLSVQVHPSDDYALREEGEYGKTEMWVVLDCVPGAELIYGFSAPITREEMRRRIEAGTLLEVVNRVPVHPGDVFFIEAGTLHAIGAGIVIAEIQQSSNLTYRVYDYDRRDAQGNPRQLHIEKALAVTDLGSAHPRSFDRTPHREGDAEVSRLGGCDYFTTDRIRLSGRCLRRVGEGSFEGLFCARGSVKLAVGDRQMTLAKGDTVFLPAGLGEYRLEGEAECLSISV